MSSQMRSGTASGLSVVVPMFNEQALARDSLGAIGAACRALVSAGRIADYEVIAVDDGSADATAMILDELATADSHIHVVHHEHNSGLGCAIRSGIARARFSLVLYMDADLPFDLAELDAACAVFDEGADVFTAYRLNRMTEGWRRMSYSFVYNLLVRFAFGLRVKDVNFAFKIVRRELLDQITLVSDGSFIDVELLVSAQRLGSEIVQRGVRYLPRSHGTSTLSSVAVIVKILKELFAFRRRSNTRCSTKPAPSGP